MSTIYDTVRAGRPLDFTPFIDVHGHFGPWQDTCVPYCTDYGRVIGEMDRFGCDMAWLSAADPGYADVMRVKNDITFTFAAQYPDRIIPYCTLSANDPDACLDELRRCLELGRCIGVKMHVYQQPAYTMKSDFLQPVLELLNEHQLLYLNHTLGPLDDLRWALARYPEVTFMAGHADGGIAAMAVTHPNLRNCTCAAMTPDWITHELRQGRRSEFMLVGSDFPLFCLAFGIGMIAYADIAESDKRNILGLNAVKLLERTAWYSPSMLHCTSA